MNNEKFITTEEFVNCLWREAAGSPSAFRGIRFADLSGRELLDYARENLWIAEQDLCAADEPLERRRAAYIIHEFLQRVLDEMDEPDWKDAEKMRDIYDCRTCANHIAQVYAKGIMSTVDYCGTVIFDSRSYVDRTEATGIINRAVNPEKRYTV